MCVSWLKGRMVVFLEIAYLLGLIDRIRIELGGGGFWR